MTEPSEPDEGTAEEPGIGPPARLPDGMGFILLLAIIPFALVWLLVTALIGDSIAKYGPFVFYFGLFGFVLWLVVKGHVAAPPGWAKVGQDFFPNSHPRRKMRLVALLLFVCFVGLTLTNIQVTMWLIWLRETLMGWTVPWPDGWG